MRNRLGIGNQYVKNGNIEIFSSNYDKFMINGVKNDDDLIENFTFKFEGYKFLEPDFISVENIETMKRIETIGKV